MNYTVIDPKNAEKLDILPDKMLEVLKAHDGFCVIADDEDTLKGMTAFSFSDTDSSVRLEYVIVPSEYRRQKVASGMLDFACDALGQGGAGRIVCSVCGKIGYISDMMQFLEAADFHITVPYDQIMEYRLKTILDNKKFHPLFAKMPDCIRSEQELLSTGVKKFFGELAEAGLVIGRDDYDHELSRFYVKDKDVEGCMLMREEDGLVSMRLFYVTDNGKDPIAFPGMLASSTKAAYEKNNKERLLRLHFRSTELRGSLMEVLGYPEYDGIFQQYERSVQAEETPGEAQTP